MNGSRSTEIGMSMMEVLVVLAIISVISVIAVPDLYSMVTSHRRAQARNQLEVDLNKAISTAARLGARCIIEAMDSEGMYSIGVDRAPFSLIASPDEILFTGSLPNGITISSEDPFIVDPRGFVIDDTGSLTNAGFSLLEDNEQFATVTVYAPGNVEFM